MADADVIYIGPYLVLKCKSIEEQQNSPPKCDTSDCNNFGKIISGNFCNLCGAAAFMVATPIMEMYGWDAFVDEFDEFEDLLYAPYSDTGCDAEMEQETLIPNTSRDIKNLAWKLTAVDDGPVELESGEGDWEPSFEAFTFRYAMLLTTLRQSGYTFEIKFGVIVH